MVRRLIAVVVTAVALGGAATSAQAAPATPSPGCKGVNNALAQAERGTKGQAALTVVADKLGCPAVPPQEPDALACPSGQSELSTWYWDPDTFVEPTRQFVKTSGTDFPRPVYAQPANPYAGAGGFYTEAGDATIQSIVIQSTTGEVVTVAGNVDPVSQNWLVDRTGMQHVRYCG